MNKTWSITAFCPKDEVTGGWLNIQNEKLHNLHSSSNITGMIKSKKTRWVGEVACTGAETC
jgi:hypothetical protein